MKMDASALRAFVYLSSGSMHVQQTRIDEEGGDLVSAFDHRDNSGFERGRRAAVMIRDSRQVST